MPPQRGERPVLLERADELASVDAVIAAALEGSGRFAAIVGPAGIGKSSILREARARATETGMTALAARGTEIERAFSYGVVRQLFETVMAHAAPERRSGLLEGAAAHAGRLFEPDELGGQPADQDAAFALVHGLYWLTLNLAEQRPLLLAIDDLQWGDEPSLRWIAYLARRLEGTAIAVLATVRAVEEEDASLAELLADADTTVVHPSALTPSAATQLVRGELGERAEEAFCLACHRTTGGNPLLLHELIRTLADEGVPPTAAAIGQVEHVAPDAVARSVKLRLSRLSPQAAGLARAVAVLGDGADGRYVAELAGIEKRELAPAAAALARVDLLRPEPPLRFVHPVVRNAVYETRPPHERAQDHAQAAAILVSASATVEQVAAQTLLAPAESVENAVPTLREAARRAAAEGAPESAASFLRRALEEPMQDDERAHVLRELAASEFSVGAPTVVERLREVVQLTEGERGAVVRLELARALYWSRHEEEAIETLEAALAEADGDDDFRRRLLAELITNASRLPGQYEAARRRLESLELEPGDGPGARMLLGMQAYQDASRGTNRDLAVSRAEQALAAMPDDERAWSYIGGLYTLLFADRFEEGLRFIDGTLAEVRRRGSVFAFSGLSMMRAIFGYARGTLVEAEADARTALEALPHSGTLFMPHVYGWLLQVLVERGAFEEAVEVLETVARDVGPPPESFSHVALIRARGVVNAARGDHEAALADALALGRVLTAVGHDNPAISYPAWRSEAALALHALARTSEAVALVREELELARVWGAPRALGRGLRVLGLVEGGDDGIERMREAVEVLEASPAGLEHAYAVTDLGAALRRGNRRAEARELLRQGLELAQRCGAIRLAQRAHEELVATGARPRRLVLSGVESLTPSERRTAAMAAEGMSNKEIAQALFVTLRTVEMHLSNTFRKLDISSRTQLTAALTSSEATPAASATG